MTNALMSGGVAAGVLRRVVGRVWGARYRWMMVASLLLGGVWSQSFAQTNEPPILGLTQPWEGANFNAPANVTLAAWAYDADGIQSIAFYDGATLLTTDTQAPYEFQWANVPAGSHSITARATELKPPRECGGFHRAKVPPSAAFDAAARHQEARSA